MHVACRKVPHVGAKKL